MHPVLGDYIREMAKASGKEKRKQAGETFLRTVSGEGAVTEPLMHMQFYKEHVGYIFNNLKNETGQDSQLTAARIALATSEISAELGDTRAAKYFGGKSYDIYRIATGAKAAETITAMHTLGKALSENGDYTEASQIQQQVVSILSETCGPNDPSVMLASSELASTLRAKGEFKEARRLQEWILHLERKRLGENDPKVLRYMSALALTMFDQGEFKNARELLEEVIDKKRSAGFGDEDMLANFNNLALIYRLQGDLAAAKKILGPLRNDVSSIRGPEQLETLAANHNYAAMLWRLGELEEAYQIEVSTVGGLERTVGALRRELVVDLEERRWHDPSRWFEKEDQRPDASSV